VDYAPVIDGRPLFKLTDAAKYYKQEPQQVSAFEWLQQQQNRQKQWPSLLKQYRATPPAPPKPEAQPGYITPDLMQAITGHPASYL